MENWADSACAQVAAIPFQQLQQRFGDRATFIANCVRGISDEPVQVRLQASSAASFLNLESTDLNSSPSLLNEDRP